MFLATSLTSHAFADRSPTGSQALSTAYSEGDRTRGFRSGLTVLYFTCLQAWNNSSQSRADIRIELKFNVTITRTATRSSLRRLYGIAP